MLQDQQNETSFQKRKEIRLVFQNAKTTAFVQWCFKTRVFLEENKSFCSSGLFLHKNTFFLFKEKKNKKRKAVSLFVRTTLLWTAPFLWILETSKEEQQKKTAEQHLIFQYKLFFCASIENKKSFLFKKEEQEEQKDSRKPPRFCSLREEKKGVFKKKAE